MGHHKGVTIPIKVTLAGSCLADSKKRIQQKMQVMKFLCL